MNSDFKKINIMFYLIVFSFIIFMLPTAAWAFTGEGNGTSEDPYQISTPEHLDSIREDLAAHYVLVNDIDLSGFYGVDEDWIPIGEAPDASNPDVHFTGTFDGGGFTISNLYINQLPLSDVGLFGYSSGTIQNVNLMSVDVTGGYSVGGLVGYNYNGTISNSSVNGTIQGIVNVGGLVGRNTRIIQSSSMVGEVIGDATGTGNIGGLVGYNETPGNISGSYTTANVTVGDNFEAIGGLVGLNLGTVTGSYASGSVTAGTMSECSGGLVGENINGNITDSYAAGNVTGEDNSINFGGLVGYNSGTVSGSHSDGNVTTGTGSFATGGLAGINTDEATITASYATGSVNAHDDTGGLVGQNNTSTIEYSFSSGPVSGASDVGGLVGTNYGSVDSSYSMSPTDGEGGVGGLIGYNDGTGTIFDSYAVGAVTGTEDVGGLVGDASGSIINSYAVGTVTGTTNTGGLLGLNNPGSSIASCAYNNETTGLSIGVGSGDDSSITALTIAEMKLETTFQDRFSTWNFGTEATWKISAGTYPYLQWQTDNVDFAPPILAEGYPQTDDVSKTEAGVIMQADEDATAYYLVLPEGAEAPAASYVKQNSDGSVFLTADTEGQETITDLDPQTTYDIYVVAEDAAGNLQFEPGYVELTTFASDGLYSFGIYSQGQLGLGDIESNVVIPSLIEGLSNVKAVAAGKEHTLVLLVNGDVYAFGNGSLNRLGTGDVVNRTSPVKINFPVPAMAVAAGEAHSLVLLENGDVYSFGYGGNGQLGHGDDGNKSLPTKIQALSDIKAISTTANHSLALTESGEVYSFGAGGDGRLGLGDGENRYTPTKIMGLSNVEAIAAGGRHSLVLLENGQVYSFGFGGNGRLGFGADDINDKNAPTLIGSITTAKAVAAGTNHSLVILENGDVFSFGFGSYGQLGHGDTNHVSIPTRIEGLSNVQDIVGGGMHTLALSESGDVYSFGRNNSGELGLGDSGDGTNRLSPTKIEGFTDVTIIAAGGEHSLLVVKSPVQIPPDHDEGGDNDQGNDDNGRGNGSGGSISPPQTDSLVITPEKARQHLLNNELLSYEFSEMNISLGPEALPEEDWETIRVEAEVITDSDTLNGFFLAYPDQKGIMKGYDVTFISRNQGQSENITQLNGDITLTFLLSSEEFAGIDPSTLMVYKQGEDGSITELSGEFDWELSTMTITTDHLCVFFLMGQEGIPVQRLAGVDRYATATAISAQGWETSDTIFLAGGENFPDALAGTALAGLQDSPVLLTASKSLNNDTLQEIRRLKAKNIYILGGEAAVSETIENQLSHDYTVTRISGSDRYETAIEIGQFIREYSDSISSSLPHSDTVILATGLNYPDALSVAPFAGQNGLPILFTQKDNLNTSTQKALADWGIKEVIIIGGNGVISEEIEELLIDELQISVKRLGGGNRYQTSLEIAKYFSPNSQYRHAALATGENYPDALAGASLGSKYKYPVLLVEKEKINNDIKSYIKDLELEKLYIYGGKEVITDKVKKEINSR